MRIERRTFLFGAAAAIAAPVFAKATYLSGPVVPVILPSTLKYRRIHDLCFSSMPTGEELKASSWKEDPVRYTFYRDEAEIFVITLNPRAAFRWVAAPDSEIIIPERSVLRMLVEPCNTYTTLSIGSNTCRTGSRDAWKRYYVESFRWKDSILEVEKATPTYLDDEVA
jgi:hypothetical protein